MNFNMSPSKIGVGGSLSAIATAAIGYVLQGKNLITRKAATVFYAASALLALISIGTAAWKSRTVTQQKPTPLEVAVQKAKDCIAAIKEENIFMILKY